MTTRSEWNALAAKCEAATGPDKAIDFLIGGLVGDFEIGGNRAMRELTFSFAPYTGSLDVIVALIERELPEWKGTVEIGDRGEFFTHLFRPGGPKVDVFAATPALTLCATFCRAKAETCEGRE